MNILQKKANREEVFLNKSFCKMIIYQVKATEKHQIHVQKQLNVGLIKANEKGIVSIKRGSRLAIKIAKKCSSMEVARVVVKKHKCRPRPIFLWF